MEMGKKRVRNKSAGRNNARERVVVPGGTITLADLCAWHTALTLIIMINGDGFSFRIYRAGSEDGKLLSHLWWPKRRRCDHSRGFALTPPQVCVVSILSLPQCVDLRTMSPLPALLVAFLLQIAVIATFDSSSYERLVAPEGDPCHAQLTCYHFSALLENGSDWYSDTVIGFLPGNYTLSRECVIANASNLTLMTLVYRGSEEQWSQRAVIDCEEEAGLIVTLSDHVHISGLTFAGCGAFDSPNAATRPSY